MNNDFYGKTTTSSKEKSLIKLYKMLNRLNTEINEALEAINQKLEWLRKNPSFSDLNDEVLDMYRANIAIYEEILSNVNTLHVKLIREVMRPYADKFVKVINEENDKS